MAEKRIKSEMTKKDKRSFWLIPIYIAAPLVLYTVAVIIASINPKDGAYALPFLEYGGDFRHSYPKILGVKFDIIIMMAGLVVAVFVSLARREAYHLKRTTAAVATVLFFIESYLGAKLLYAVEKYIDTKEWTFSGQSLFGVLYIAVVGVPLLSMLFHKKIADMSDFFVTTYLILLSFIRTSCYITGCCGAKERFLAGVLVILPVQLFEVIIDLLILSLCLWLDRPTENSARGRAIAPVLLMTYCLSRFFLEFLRSNPAFFIGLTMAQCHCLIFFTLGTAWYLYAQKH